MGACLVCEIEVRVGTLCRDHALALATCDDITAEQVISSDESTPQAWLIDQWGSTHGLTVPAIVGRSVSDCNLGILHPSISVLHAQIERRDHQWHVVDRGSLNGTKVNDSEVRATTLISGDHIQFGDVSFYFSAGELPAVSEHGKTGSTRPSREEDLALHVVLSLASGGVELVQRPGGGILRQEGEIKLELAQLEFSLLARLARARLRSGDAELAFVSSRDLASELDFKSRQADSDNVRELVRRVRKKIAGAQLMDIIDSRQRVGYRIACDVSVPTSR